MKTTYQVPETEILISTYKYTIMDPSGGENNNGNTLGNENKTFDEEISTDVSQSSSLWDN